MSKVVQVFRTDRNNIGDWYSNPLRYFMKEEDLITVDIANPHLTTYESNLPIVVGGGGLIENELFGEFVDTITRNSDETRLQHMYDNAWECSYANNQGVHKAFMDKFDNIFKEALRQLKPHNGTKIIWGAGHNIKGATKQKFPRFLRNFDLVGIRDVTDTYEWVPCASCMHPAFRKQYNVTNDIIWFEHKKQLIKASDFGDTPIPRFVNTGQNLDLVAEILGSANIVVTNSYHGAYWATILGKRVVVVDPWSSKFNAMKHEPTFARSKDWIPALEEAQSYPNALDECINANEKYWKKVKGML